MSLSANMWTSVSGLMTHGEKMNVIGNNLANVSTIGFKAQRADFSDFIYTDYGTTSGADQVGKGVGICALIGDFSQGGFENTNSATDLAINGNGFFKVHNDANNTDYYTRAGDFYFDEDRQLINPNGMILQGWRTTQTKKVTLASSTVTLSNEAAEFRRTGSVTDIVLDKWNIPPERTTNVTVADNLINDDHYDITQSDTSPLTALFDTWDGSATPPISDDAYATQNTIAVYDEGGKSHNVTVYMDKVKSTKIDSNGNAIYNVEGLPAGYTMYEYLVTVDPSEDKRTYGGTYDPETGVVSDATSFYNEADPKSSAKKCGVLMDGVMIFDASGQLVSQSAYTYGQNNPLYTEDDEASHSTKINIDPDEPSSWVPTKFSNNGLPVFVANFTGNPLANSISEYGAKDAIVELDLGLSSGTVHWTNDNKNDETSSYTSTTTLADLAVDGGVVNYENIAKIDGAIRDSNATACNGATFMTDIQDNGYPAGVLSNYTVDKSGVVYGYYNNGENIPLYQIAMYDFHNLQGLHREGGNLYSPTHESGTAVEGVAGTGTFGEINSYYIENSNVDMSREFVHMISTQRGFQANSKSITTTDTMLETVIGMKR
ncbi:MAG: flagellar hook-basal body complex protein [Desulfovibrio sp.]|nr:flagellar hook-basal body complex protein [Desulfovibrio sp.]